MNLEIDPKVFAKTIEQVVASALDQFTDELKKRIDTAMVAPSLKNTRQAAKWLGCSERTVTNRVADGSLIAVRSNGMLRFRVEDLQDFATRARAVKAAKSQPAAAE